MKDLVASIEQCLPILDEMEKYTFSNVDSEPPHWAFSGAVRTILDLTCDKYYLKRKKSLPSYVRDSREKYKAIIEKIKNSHR
ncbi:hypothetical protein D3C79_1015820 [compost metagenome]